MIIADEKIVRTPSDKTGSPTSPKVGNLIDIDSPVHEKNASSRTPTDPEPRPPSGASNSAHSGASAGSSAPASAPCSPQNNGNRVIELASSLTGSLTTGSAHTLEGTQTFNNQAFDGVSVSETEHATDVSTMHCYIVIVTKL